MASSALPKLLYINQTGMLRSVSRCSGLYHTECHERSVRYTHPSRSVALSTSGGRQHHSLQPLNKIDHATCSTYGAKVNIWLSHTYILYEGAVDVRLWGGCGSACLHTADAPHTPLRETGRSQPLRKGRRVARAAQALVGDCT
jgi:hypothetical protein